MIACRDTVLDVDFDGAHQSLPGQSCLVQSLHDDVGCVDQLSIELMQQQGLRVSGM